MRPLPPKDSSTLPWAAYATDAPGAVDERRPAQPPAPADAGQVSRGPARVPALDADLRAVGVPPAGGRSRAARGRYVRDLVGGRHLSRRPAVRHAGLGSDPSAEAPRGAVGAGPAGAAPLPGDPGV